MSDWIEAEMAACQRHATRPTKRLARLFARLCVRPVHRLPTAWHGWAEMVAASRFWAHPDVGVQAMLSGHTHATRERLRPQEVVVLVQGPPLLHDGTTQPQAGMGTVKRQRRDESRLHSRGACTPARVH